MKLIDKASFKMNIIDRVKLYGVEGSDGSYEKLVALTHAAAIKLMKDAKGHPEGVTYMATEIPFEDTGAE